MIQIKIIDSKTHKEIFKRITDFDPYIVMKKKKLTYFDEIDKVNKSVHLKKNHTIIIYNLK